MKRLVRSMGMCALVLALAVPTVAFATDFTSEAGFVYDVQDGLGSGTADGSMSNGGTTDAYDGCYQLRVNSASYDGRAGGTARLTLGSRQTELPVVSVGGAQVQRLIYVPAAGGNYARYLDVVANPGATPLVVTVNIAGDLGSDSSTVVTGSSSGDMTVDTTDNWFATDDGDMTGDPSLAHVVQGAGGRVRANAISGTGGNISYSFMTTIPAGGRAAFLTFAIQASSRAASMTEARRVSELPDDALTGLDDYLEDIVNFSVATAGAPRVRFGGPVSANEGDELVITAEVTDPEGDSVTWSWDIDGDGTFGEMPGATSVTVPAGSTDGPGSYRVGVSASDGTNVSERYRNVSITNVAPVITSSAMTMTSVGAAYRYPLVVEDPGGTHDPLTFAVTRGPMGMTVSASGIVMWSPTERDVTGPGESIPVTITVDDGDMGTTTQMWDLTVSPNRAPSAPTPLYPINGVGLANAAPRLVVQNATDPDLDTLTYYFEIDSVATFDSEGKLASGPISETPGFSFWQLSSNLPPGLWFWRAWVNDGTVSTDPVSQSFFVVPDPSQIDAGVPSGDDGGTRRDAGTGGGGGGGSGDGGCSVTSTAAGSQPVAAVGLAGLALAVFGLRRKRRHRRP